MQLPPFASGHRLLRARGFALVVTLSLMILLTLIAVGLLTLSSIALRSSNSSLAMLEARQNARMALLLAVGDLQKHTGQDQRVTATADIAGNSLGQGLAAGDPPQNDKSINGVSKGLSSIQPGTRYWTGVFANSETGNPLSAVLWQTPSPTIVRWLVSGDTGSGPGPLPSALVCAISQNGDVADASKAVVLAGRQSLGVGVEKVDRYVSVPLVQIIDGRTSKPSGRYGWWVGDEGVKARINMPKTLDDRTNYSSLVAQRRGWEVVEGFNDPASPYPAPNSAGQQSLSKIISLPETALLLPSAGSQAGGASPLQSVFHSATADSRGLLTDSLSGGTKVDLTAALAIDLAASTPLPEVENYPIKNASVIPTKIGGNNTVAYKMQAPRWDAIKDFFDRSAQLDGGSLVAKGATSDFTAAIAPVVTDFRVLMGVRIKAKDLVAGTFHVTACGKIAVAIANPYSVPLKWTKDIEIELRNQSPTGVSPSRIEGNLPVRPAFISSTEPAVFRDAVFRIRASSLSAGEARAYTVGSYVKRPAGSTPPPVVVVDLVPFESSVPYSFNNCVELDNTTIYTPASMLNSRFELDVRESWQSSLGTVEIGLADTSTSTRLLRRIERFEFDNGYFMPNQRRFTKDEAASMTQPFPLMLYSFQISQPGVEYYNYMPAGYEMGQRASTLRTFADFNLQATRIRKPIASYNPPPYFAESTDSIAQLPASPPGGATGSGFTRNLAVSPLRWGRSPFGPEKTVLFSVPSRFSTLAQLQHADLTGDDLNASVCHQPGNAVGNSYATPFVKRSLTAQTRTSYELVGTGSNRNGTNNSSTTYYDLSYLLNCSLWDSYFFSTIPRAGAKTPENPTLIPVSPDLASPDFKDPVAAASNLMIDGAFNVNSTDKNAWKAFLASAKHFHHAAGPANVSDAAFPRSLEQPDPSASKPTGSEVDSFSGYRRLTDAQLDSLAAEIVKQVRRRGPFLSVSHFVNRALAKIDAEPAMTRSGALQSAIDESGANISFQGKKNGFTKISASADAVKLAWKDGAPRADYDGSATANRPSDADPQHPDWAMTSIDTNYGAVASIVADQEMLKDASYIPEQGFRSTGIPGWLTQADVLQVIGSSITARSDTFRIRAFGEALDPSGKSLAKAYCEAIVQRIPSYTDPSNPPAARGTNLSALNKTFGRNYRIISFRWLSPQEI